MMQTLTANTTQFKITLFDQRNENQGIVHIIGPQLGLTQPGTVIACGDSHTSTHGAFGAIAFGIGTTQIACVLATQSLPLKRPKVRRIQVDGKLKPGVTAKDVTLRVIHDLGVQGGIGYAYEYGGTTFDAMSMEERMTVCNMSIEGGARCGYVNPDKTTIEYLRGRKCVPTGARFEEAAAHWLSFASGPDAEYDDVYTLDAQDIKPMMTWGINPGQSISASGTIPIPATDDKGTQAALTYMQFEGGAPLKGTKVNVAFVGSCTNGRLSDFREVGDLLRKHGGKVAPHVKAIAVPGSVEVDRLARQEGLDKVFTEAGFEWRQPGCSMCLAMNPDKLVGDQLCVSSSNRNFKGRQGSKTGRTILMSPIGVAACAVAGEIVDVQELYFPES
jgi:3-isopropylmalate/(R)-2-methylmalate dehydratase large subunit